MYNCQLNMRWVCFFFSFFAAHLGMQVYAGVVGLGLEASGAAARLQMRLCFVFWKCRLSS